jgi:hypothetical protein
MLNRVSIHHGHLPTATALFVFRTKTQSHEEAALAAKRLFFSTLRSAAPTAKKMGLSARTAFFVALCLCAKQEALRLRKSAGYRC